MKSAKTNPPTSERETKTKSKFKALPVQYQGSRFSSLVLLLVTILVSLAFYVSGQ